jgi:hypothetical protein
MDHSSTSLIGREYSWPLSFGMPEYRDYLCAQIGKSVGGASVEASMNLCLYFTDGSIIEASLLPGPWKGRETVVFQDGNGGFSVW